LKIDISLFFVMTHDGKLASEWTFEPCENGTNDPTVHRPLRILLMSSA